jgi:hypothetical protein
MKELKDVVDKIKLQDNLYIVCKVIVDEGMMSLHINSEISNSVVSSIINYINDEFTDIVMVFRTEEEPHSDSYPTQEQQILLLKGVKVKHKVFYQDPWPSNVPNFLKDKSVIRFGYDEGCKFDTSTLNKKIKTKKSNGEYYYLINKNKNIEIELKNSLI